MSIQFMNIRLIDLSLEKFHPRRQDTITRAKWLSLRLLYNLIILWQNVVLKPSIFGSHESKHEKYYFKYFEITCHDFCFGFIFVFIPRCVFLLFAKILVNLVYFFKLLSAVPNLEWTFLDRRFFDWIRRYLFQYL